MAFDRWQQQLHELLKAVHVKQQQYDQASTACQVLLKPWPKKSKESECAAKKDASNSSNDAAHVQISPHEEAELKVVNDLLRRAQKTRVKPAFKKLKEHGSTVGDDQPTSRSEKEERETCDSEPPTVQEPVPKEDAQPAHSKPVPVIKTNGSLRKNVGTARTEHFTKNTVRKQQQRNQPVKENGDESARSVSREASTRPISRHHVAGSIATKPAPTVDQKRSKSSESMEISRPSSRPRSGHGNFKPAHATAPFKTDPTLHVPKRSAKNSIRPVKHQPLSKRQNYTGDKNYTNKVLPPIASERDLSPSLVSSVPGDNVLWDVCDTPSETNGELLPKMEHDTETGCGEILNSELSGLTLESHPAQVVTCESSDVSVKVPHPEASSSKPEGEQDIKMFSLLSNGSSIHIPPKVRRAFAKNQQLRKKVSQRHTERKPKMEATNMGEKFADKLQQFFDPEEELVYRQQALECLRAHQQLLHLLIQLRLDQLTEASSAKDVLRVKMLAEFVLSSFSAFSEEISVLSKVQFPDTPAVAQPLHKEVGRLYQWLPASLQGENMCSADKLHYTSKKDLSQYMSVMLRLQNLKCQHHLMDILVNDILPWLQKQDCCHEDFGAIFRGLFALLTSDGCQLPVLIRDTM